MKRSSWAGLLVASLSAHTVLAGLAGLSFAAGPYREFYVSPSGADTNDGTIDKPFRTLAHARDAVRNVNREMTGDVVVYLRGGTYAVKSPIYFGVEDSGFNGFHVIYRAFKNEVPVISGGIPVTGWTLDHDGIYKSTLKWDGKLRSLYVNDARAKMTEATFTPQGPWGEFVVKGDEPWAETAGKTFDGILFNRSEVPAFGNPSDVELMQKRKWTFPIVGVRDMVTDGDHTIMKLQQPLGAIAATMAWHCYIDPKKPIILRNAYELLKEPGQFYFNRTTHTLYYYPRAGENMATATVIAPLSEGLLRITGSSCTKHVQNLTFTGLTFSYDHWLLKQVGDSRGMIGVQSLGLYTKFRADGNWHKTHYDICDLPQATVELLNCDHIRFERDRFRHLASGTGISFTNDVTDSAAVGNVFDDLSGNAVNVGHPQHYIIGDGPLYPKGVEGVCARIVVKDNYLRHVCVEFLQEEAISGFFTQSVEISHNDIKGVPYGGIALGWWWGNSELPPSTVPKNNTIAFNRLEATQQELPGDGGSIYVLGEQPGGVIEDNYIKSPTRCIYPDDGSAYWTIRQNVVDPLPHGSPKALHHPLWLHVWTPRCHDMRIEDNYTTLAAALNKGTRTPAIDTHVENPLGPAAQAIIAKTGLEPAYRDIAKEESAKKEP